MRIIIVLVALIAGAVYARGTMSADFVTADKIYGYSELTAVQKIQLKGLLAITPRVTQDLFFAKYDCNKLGVFVQYPFSDGMWFRLKDKDDESKK